jgi:hypothetical protein
MLAIWGMSFGLYYALFVEHQTLNQIGGSLAGGFSKAASGDLMAARASLQVYADTQFDYVRSVDVHSHWIGLAMMLIIFGIVFDRLRLAEKQRLLLSWLLCVGSVIFPLGVILQTLDRGIMPRAVAAFGAAMVIIALAAVALGFVRRERN